MRCCAVRVGSPLQGQVKREGRAGAAVLASLVAYDWEMAEWACWGVWFGMKPMWMHVVVAVLEELSILPLLLKMSVPESVVQYHEASDVDYPRSVQ